MYIPFNVELGSLNINSFEGFAWIAVNIDNSKLNEF